MKGRTGEASPSSWRRGRFIHTLNNSGCDGALGILKRRSVVEKLACDLARQRAMLGEIVLDRSHKNKRWPIVGLVILVMAGSPQGCRRDGQGGHPQPHSDIDDSVEAGAVDDAPSQSAQDSGRDGSARCCVGRANGPPSAAGALNTGSLCGAQRGRALCLAAASHGRRTAPNHDRL